MTQSEIKEAVLKTLRKVEPQDDLEIFVQALKMETLFRLMIGEITDETADTILDTIKEFWGEFLG